MNKAQVSGGLVAASALLLFIWLSNSGGTARTQSAEPLEGALYRGEIPELAKADPPFPEPASTSRQDARPVITVSQANLDQLGLSTSSGPYTVNVTSAPRAPYRVVRNRRQNALVAAGPPTAVLPTAARDNEPGAIHTARDFKYYDRLIETHDASCLLPGRYTAGDITLQLVKMLKWGRQYLLKLSIVNEGEREYFIAGARVITNEGLVSARGYLPFSCRPGETEEGVVAFPVASVAGRRVSLQICESGRKACALEIKHVDYPF